MSRRVAERPRTHAAPGRRGGVRPHVKLWLESGGESVLCRNMSEILKAVDETGSIKKASAAVGRSYRFVWSRIKDSEKSIGAALVETHVGGRDAKRSRLTPLARDLVTSFDRLRAEVSRLIDGAFSRELQETLRRYGCRG